MAQSLRIDSKKYLSLLFMISLTMLNVNIITIAFDYLHRSIFHYKNAFFLSQMIITAPAIGVCLTSLFLSFFCKNISRLHIANVGCIIIIFYGIITYYVTDPYIMIIMRIILGIGSSFIFAGGFGLAKIILSELQLRHFFSAVNASNSVILFIWVFIGSKIIKNYHWRTIFLMHLMGLIAIVTLDIYFKDLKTTLRRDIHNSNSFDNIKINYWYLFIAIIIIFYQANLWSFATINIVPILIEKNFYTVENSALIMSMLQIGIISGSFFNYKVSRFIMPFIMALISIFLLFISFILISQTSSFFWYRISCIINGFSFGIFIANNTPWILRIVGKNMAHFGINIVTSIIYAGFFISPILLSYIQKGYAITTIHQYLATILLLLPLLIIKNIKILK
jgi:MFS family permease